MSGSSPESPSISAVIPTRNRRDSLLRLLHSLGAQNPLPGETLIVDASDAPIDRREARLLFPSLNISVIKESPSVCRQRNIGIRRASGEFILLADDDVEFAPDYLATLLEYLRKNPAEGALSGMQHDLSANGVSLPDRASLKIPGLLWSVIFQTSVWGTLDALRRNPLLQPVARFYDRRGNGFTLAGWPLLTHADAPAFRTAVYGLGAALIRKSWLVDSPYDESLDASGIGDHYGVAIRFPGPFPVVVLTGTHFIHHRSPVDRIPPRKAYALRVRALMHFLARDRKFGLLKKMVFRWSLLGNSLRFLIVGRASRR